MLVFRFRILPGHSWSVLTIFIDRSERIARLKNAAQVHLLLCSFARPVAYWLRYQIPATTIFRTRVLDISSRTLWSEVRIHPTVRGRARRANFVCSRRCSMMLCMTFIFIHEASWSLHYQNAMMWICPTLPTPFQCRWWSEEPFPIILFYGCGMLPAKSRCGLERYYHCCYRLQFFTHCIMRIKSLVSPAANVVPSLMITVEEYHDVSQSSTHIMILASLWRGDFLLGTLFVLAAWQWAFSGYRVIPVFTIHGIVYDKFEFVSHSYPEQSII